MNYRAKHLPEHWQKWVENHPDLSQGRCTPEFNGTVTLEWEDGSAAFFRYAFLVEDKDRKEILVLTEHCGYHVFRTPGLDFSQSKNKV